MKKIILSLVLTIGLMFSTTFAYNLNVKDTKLVNKINKRIDLINKNAPKKIEDIHDKIQKLLNVKLKGKENTRIYALINEINIHIEKLLNIKEETDDGDLNDLLFGEEQNEINNKKNDKKIINEYYTDSKGRRFKFYDIRDKSYLNEGFSCKTKHKYCKEMDSCSEATYYYKVCNAKSFDRDNDGIPCENICGEKIKVYEY